MELKSEDEYVVVNGYAHCSVSSMRLEQLGVCAKRVIPID